MPAKQYEVVIKLISNQHPCHSGHKIGDEWVFDYFTPAHMCGMAYNTIYPVALALSIGGTFPGRKTRMLSPSPARMAKCITFSSSAAVKRNK